MRRQTPSAAGTELPTGLASSAEHIQPARFKKIECNREYSAQSLLFIFLFFSLVGWVWEGLFRLYTDGHFVNRGLLNGPWLPIYGFGCIMMIVLLKYILNNPFFTFFSITILCSVIEYLTSWFLEFVSGERWWDYSEYILNINGRISIGAALLFGFGGCCFLYLLGPVTDYIYNKLPGKLQLTLLIVMLTFFCSDCLYSLRNPNTGKGVTDYPVVTKQETLTFSEWMEQTLPHIR